MNFDLAVRIVLMHEGGEKLTEDPRDSGGKTRYGISQKAFPTENIALLTQERAKELYKKHYWDACECDIIPPWARLIVFDCAVNQGVPRAINYIQRILKVTVDGSIGPKTIEAFVGVPAKEFLSSYTLRRFDSYQSHPKWNVYGKGWMKRLFEISLFAMISVGEKSVDPMGLT